MTDTSLLETELGQPVPRRVTLRAGRGRGLWFLRLLLLPLIAIGLIAIGWALIATLNVVFSTTVAGKITSQYAYHAGEGVIYDLGYNYRFHGVTYHARCSISSLDFSAFDVNSPVSVRVFPAWPQHGSMLVVADNSSSTFVRVLWAFAAFWNVLLTVLLWAAYVSPHRIRSLLVSGRATRGRVARKQVSRGEDSRTYLVFYEYEAEPLLASQAHGAAATATTLHGRMAIRREDWASVEVGDHVTVLYDPRHPLRSVLYRFSDYRVVG